MKNVLLASLIVGLFSVSSAFAEQKAVKKVKGGKHAAHGKKGVAEDMVEDEAHHKDHPDHKKGDEAVPAEGDEHHEDGHGKKPAPKPATSH